MVAVAKAKMEVYCRNGKVALRCWLMSAISSRLL